MAYDNRGNRPVHSHVTKEIGLLWAPDDGEKNPHVEAHGYIDLSLLGRVRIQVVRIPSNTGLGRKHADFRVLAFVERMIKPHMLEVEFVEEDKQDEADTKDPAHGG